jgi:hypothetical protein
MNYKKACFHLDIVEDDEYDINKIKKQYKLKALLYHPDKNQSLDASAKFQEIHDSYEYLMNCSENISIDDDNDIDYWDEYENLIDKSTYKWVLFSFLKNILQTESKNKLFYIILQRVVSSCESKALDTLAKLDKTTLIKIYEILKLYEDAFHFTKEFIYRIEVLIADKIKDDECIILNPTIDDLFDNNLYRLTVNDFTYIVPLWHDELIYDNSGNDIFVKCNPILPENMYIDNRNDIHITVTYKIHELWDKESVEIILGHNKKIIIDPQLLKLTKNQKVVFNKQGLSKINTESIYDVSKLGDIHVHIKIDI